MWVLSIVSLVALGGSAMTTCSRAKSAEERGTQSDTSPVAMSLGEMKFTTNQVRRALSSVRSSGFDINSDALQIAQTVTSLSEPGYYLTLAKNKGIVLDDNTILAAQKDGLENQIQTMRFQMMLQKQLSEKATDAEFAKLFKEKTGKDLEALKTDYIAETKSKLANPEERILLAAQAISQKLPDLIAKQLVVTPDQVKTANDSVAVKRITFSAETPQAKAEEVLAALKKGASFEENIDKYSIDIPTQGKKKAEDKPMYSVTQLEGVAGLKPILSLKPGELSGVLDSGKNLVIVKFIERRATPRTDYDKNKERYTEDYKRTVAQYQMEYDLQKLKKSVRPEYKDASLEAIASYARLQEGSKPSSAALKELLEKLKALATSEFQREVLFVRYAVATDLAKENPIDSKVKDEVFEASNMVLTVTENFDLRLQLAEQFAAKGDKENAGKNLAEAAQVNNLPDASGQGRYNRINALTEKLKNQKMLSEEDLKRIEKAQADWRAEFKLKSERDAEIAAEKAKAAKEAAAEKAKADAAKPKPGAIPVTPEKGK